MNLPFAGALFNQIQSSAGLVRQDVEAQRQWLAAGHQAVGARRRFPPLPAKTGRGL